MQADSIYGILAVLPIALLLIVSLWKSVKAGVYAGLAVTAVLFFVWDSNWLAFPASFIAAFVDTVNILMIVFGALLLYSTMEQKGFVEGIKGSLQGVHSDKGFQFYFLAFFLTAFFESVAGFGTPGAIVPLLLVSMGFPAVMSISAVLLIDGLFAVAGAVGTPVAAGFVAPLGLSSELAQEIYRYAAPAVAIAGLLILWYINRFLLGKNGVSIKYSWPIYLSLMLPFAGLSYYLTELTGVVSAIIMGAVCYIFFFTNKKLDWQCWLPYILLVGILLLPKLMPSLGAVLALEVPFEELLGTEVSASIKPLRSPLLPFVVATAFAIFLSKEYSISLKPVLSKTGSVFLVLFPSLAITRLMLSSGVDMPSMVESLASVFVKSGEIYPIISPLIGVLGAFITGSTTVSNVIFGPVQLNAAQSLALPESVVLALQLAGASLGNAVCLFNIIAAAAVAGVDDYSDILKKNILPIAGATAIVGLLGYLVIKVGFV